MKFINPSTVVAQMGLKNGQTVVDLGCGAGFYTLAAARAVGDNGMVHAIDVQDAKLAATQSAARQNGLNNITTLKADLDKPLLSIAEGACDAVVMGSIVHEISSREALFKNAYRILKTGGKVLVVEWKKEMTPLGPPIDKRVAEQELEAEFAKIGMRKEKELHADGYHYAILFVK
jgi:ubiquinone/menaquinone biosynthesis C-methylase UbiE